MQRDRERPDLMREAATSRTAAGLPSEAKNNGHELKAETLSPLPPVPELQRQQKHGTVLEMAGGKPTGKPDGKTARQLFFSEALQHSRPTTTTVGPPTTVLPHTMARPEQETTMERKLQEITGVGRRIEGMDSAISSLTTETCNDHGAPP
ncbi:hypothetical protein NDU88_010200 [Pleurodeles waltl]|uniref:Uncharacterized protein n=1 Tax=Pleurodeles waltl TaxID=8319 RepID=A0AAV7S1Y0_PLEWA|nr:hypothetical protein NDU88_010200 [Pleurodeles waltl]